MEEYKLTVRDDGLIQVGELPEQEDCAAPEPLTVAKSQWGRGARKHKSDCGPATVAMVGEGYRPSARPTVDAIMDWITGGVNRNTSADELIRAADHFYGLSLRKVYSASWDAMKAEVESGNPVIALVHYGNFVCRIDRGFSGGHWLVIDEFDAIEFEGEMVERAIVNDPDWWGRYIAQGARFPVVKPMFMDMWENAYLDRNPRRMMLVAEYA